MNDQLIHSSELKEDIERLTTYFNLSPARLPKVEFDESLPGEGKFYYQREPAFHGYIKINRAAPMTQAKGISFVLEHSLIHWVACENDLNRYRGSPSHLLHAIYQGEEEQRRLSEIAHPHMATDIFFGKYADPQERERLLRFVDSHYAELRTRVTQYSATDGSASAQNLRQIHKILLEAQAFTQRHRTLNVGEELMYSFICQDYADLLSLYGAEKLDQKPFQAIAFLRKLQQQREMTLENIGKSKLTFFLHFDKYAALLDQFSYSG